MRIQHFAHTYTHIEDLEPQLQWLRVHLNIRSMSRRLCVVIVSFINYGKPVHALNSTPDPSCGLTHQSHLCHYVEKTTSGLWLMSIFPPFIQLCVNPVPV